MTRTEEELRQLRAAKAKRKKNLREAAKILKGADKDLVTQLIHEYESRLKEQN